MHEDNSSAGLVQEEHGYEQESTLYTEVNTVSNSNSRVITQASEIIGTSQIQPSEHYNCAVKRKEVSITMDPSHSLYCFFKLLPSGNWFRAPLAKKRLT